MRELKFRVWDKSDKRFLYYSAQDIGAGYSPHDGVVEYGVENLSQFTGLSDREGKEIYEGDIVLSLHRDNYGTSVRKKYRVVEYKYAGSYTGYNLRSTTVCEVVGNIYEDPELLERCGK